MTGLSNVVSLPASRYWDVAARDLQLTARITRRVAGELLATAEALEAKLDLADSVIEQIDDPILRQDKRKQNAEDRRVLKASIEMLREWFCATNGQGAAMPLNFFDR